MAFTFLCCALYILVFALVYNSVILPNSGEKARKDDKKVTKIFIGTLSVIFIIQLISTCFSIGYIQDTGLFKSWASFGEKYHIWQYYTTEKYVDYPPVYLMVLFAAGKVASIFKVNTDMKAYLAFVRFVPILFDFFSSLFIYKYSKEKIGTAAAAGLGFLCAVNPINIFNSTVWGQIDSVVTLMLCFILIFLYEKKYVPSVLLFVLSVLTKPQMIIYAPVIGFTLLFDFLESFPDKKQRNKMLRDGLISVLGAAAIVLVVPIPVTGGNYGLLIEKYKQALGLYQYATVCAANFYGAIGANWVKNTETFLFFTYKTWGFIFIVIMSLLIGFVSYAVKDRKKIFFLAAFTTATIYMFAHGMHERYLFSVFMILMIIYILTNNKKVLLTYLFFSCTNLINCSQVMLKNHASDFVYRDNTLFILTSIANLIIYGFMIYVFFTALFGKEKEGKSQKNNKKPAAQKQKRPAAAAHKKPSSALSKKIVKNRGMRFAPPEEKVKITRVDFLIMAAVMLVYSVCAFYNLGSRSVPEEGWHATAANDTVVLDLGKECSINRVYTYAGWIDRHTETRDIKRTLTFEYSADGENYEKSETNVVLDKIFSWKVTEIPVTARFIRLTTDDGRFYLNEICFFGASEAEKYSPVSAEGSEGSEHLIDEQDKVRYKFSWYDGTYFDEIYHPRTAYEYIHHLYPYENTHPPLGKVIISLGMLIFGINPFGWRFFGTLCGVLMVPAVYIMGKKMFKKTFFAFCAMVIYTFDFMHLTQTRLATIDSYTAFFIMGMYYFMYIYSKRSVYNEGIKKTFVPLALSGVCFGLGVATKWQGIYAGAGLAVIFFTVLYKRYKEYIYADEIVRQKRKNAEITLEKAEKIQKSFGGLWKKTLACGVIFFVFVPALIYFLAYIPAMNTESTGLKFFFTNQTSMYNYHSTLKSSHPYMSSWWSWPLDLKPLYASGPNRMFVPEGMSQGISTFGNPIVWWLTIPVVAGAVYMFIKKKGDNELFVMLMGFCSTYLPWVLVSRSSYIYHFFPCVFFVVLMIVYFMKKLTEKYKKAYIFICIYLAAAVVLFAMFYPVLTGIEVPTHYVTTFLKWLPSWVLG